MLGVEADDGANQLQGVVFSASETLDGRAAGVDSNPQLTTAFDRGRAAAR